MTMHVLDTAIFRTQAAIGDANALINRVEPEALIIVIHSCYDPDDDPPAPQATAPIEAGSTDFQSP